MKGVSFDYNDIDKRVSMVVDPVLCDAKNLDSIQLKDFFERSPFGEHLLDEQALDSAIKTVTNRINDAKTAEVSTAIALQVDAKLTVEVDTESLNVTATIESAYGGNPVKVEEVIARLSLLGITRGISTKRIKALVQAARKLKPGNNVSGTIARGLPPRKGRDSRVKLAVNDASSREYVPQHITRHRVDMRNLGRIVTVKENDVIANVLPPRPGRNGYDVYGRALMAKEGKFIAPVLGDNTALHPENNKEIIATVSGQPKSVDGIIFVDDVYSVNGVNVKTGNIDYNGAVVVNGDVTESMRIIASGDITVNGFVESAYIKTEGNIVITEGINGKQDANDCVLEAGGCISVGHAQHVNIVTQRDLIVTKQLSHSTINCAGDLVVGAPRDNADGSLIACRIIAGGKVCAGNIGSVSGSKLTIDYTDAIAGHQAIRKSLRELRSTLATNSATHEGALDTINKYRVDDSLRDKIELLNKAIGEQRTLLAWVETAETDAIEKLKALTDGLQVQAYNQLFAGVKITTGEASLEIDKTLENSSVEFDEEQLVVLPLGTVS